MPENCSACKFKKRYDQKPRSLLGRLWRWHINWCPGWRQYMASLEPPDREALIETYGLREKGFEGSRGRGVK